MNKNNNTKKGFILGSEENDKNAGWSQTVRYMATPTGTIVLVNTKQKDSSGKYSLSESMVLVSDSVIEIYEEPITDANITIYAMISEDKL